MKPKHQHDCDKCVFVGQKINRDGTVLDLYYHERIQCNDVGKDYYVVDLIARHGEEGEYRSVGTVFQVDDKPKFLDHLICLYQGMKTLYFRSVISSDGYAESVLGEYIKDKAKQHFDNEVGYSYGFKYKHNHENKEG